MDAAGALGGLCRSPKDIDEAAKVSKTIRYQVHTIRRHASDNKLTLIREEAFLEVEPDRGTLHVLDSMRKIADYCKEQRAILLYVDFARVQGWRSHAPLTEWLAQKEIESCPIWPNPVKISGKTFDPEQHFANWRARQHAWTAGKDERVLKARLRAEALKADGLKNPAIAKVLNSEGLSSATGKAWTADTVRKLKLTAPLCKQL